MNKEIEIKYEVDSTIEAIKDKLDEKFSLLNTKHEIDIYYDSKHKDFIETEECLRIRKSESKTELTWKPPTTDAMREKKQFWKEEINAPIFDDIEPLRKILNRLDFIEYSVVDKTRMYYSVDDVTTITLDIVENAGVFLEIETMSDKEEEAVLKNEALALELGLDTAKIVNIPYRDLVVKN